MSLKRKLLVSLLGLLSLGMLAGGDCEIDIDGFPGWYAYEDPVVIYDPPIYYDPYYPCCY